MSSTYFQVEDHVIPAQHIREYPRATANSQEAVLKLAVRHYRPLSNLRPQPGDVTIIGAHGNGFPKELYEPLWDDILERSQALNFRIRGIWAMDISNQGESGVLNENEMANDPSWFDTSRDMLHMINLFRDEMPRPIVGIGHSMGACQLTQLSLFHPRLLTTLILMEPVIRHFGDGEFDEKPHPNVQASTFRRDVWPSRQSAEAAFRKNKQLQVWDPRVLTLWFDNGFREVPTAIYPEASTETAGQNPVTLKTTKHQEVFSFQRPNLPSSYPEGKPRQSNFFTHPDLAETDVGYPVYRPEPVSVLQNLPFVRPSVLYIFGSKSNVNPAADQTQKHESTGTGLGGSGGAAKGRVKSVVAKNTTHFVPMESVGFCASASAEWLNSELTKWKDQERQFNDSWGQVGKQEKQMMSDEWKGVMTNEGWKVAVAKGKGMSRL